MQVVEDMVDDAAARRMMVAISLWLM